jgi:hypothetical protein
MPREIKSDITYIKRFNPINTAKIEEILAAKFGEIVRWAIVDCTDGELKLSITYLV